MAESNKCSNDLVDDENRNLSSVVCRHCNCLMLKPSTASITYLEKSFPLTTKPNDDENKEETLNRFWLVEDMYLFENMGFSKTVDNIKYLACAECDVGPIGWHDLISKKNYLSIDRTLSLGNS